MGEVPASVTLPPNIAPEAEMAVTVGVVTVGLAGGIVEKVESGE